MYTLFILKLAYWTIHIKALAVLKGAASRYERWIEAHANSSLGIVQSGPFPEKAGSSPLQGQSSDGETP